MHRFTRGDAPVDMTRARKKYTDWTAFSRSEEHGQLGTALHERQSKYCAYCAKYLSEKREGHIEHLERRSDNPKRTFDWRNLFFSCNHLYSCGKYKDTLKIKFKPEDIVDPSQEDPADFFYFDSNGFIWARSGAGEARAKETIRVFNLNAPQLVSARRHVARAVEKLYAYSDKELDEFLASMSECDYLVVWYMLLGRKMP